MKKRTVKLTYAEMQLAGLAGIQRQIQNLKDRSKPAHGADDQNDWQKHIEGCLGEMALAKYLGVYWGGKGFKGDFDVLDVDARTASKDYYCLILHNTDEDERFVYLLTGINGTYEVRGGMNAKEGKKPEFWKEYYKGRGAYFVPQKLLRFPCPEKDGL